MSTRGATPRRGIARSALLTSLVLRTAVERLFARPGATGWSPRETDVVVSGLSRLRGLAVKLAQWLAEEDDLLPAELRDQLGAAFGMLEPMPRRDLLAVMRRALGRPVHDVFTTFDPDPVAAASIGQVHRATHAEHGALAIKVQYPGLADTIRGDLRVVRGMMTVMPWSRAHLAVVAELSDRFLEEVDYRHEAAALAWFGPRLAPLGVLTPDPILELSSERVLAMRWVDGVSLDAWAATATTAERSALATRILSAWRAMATQLGRLHADPSRGNLRVQDGTPVLLDFGCTRTLSPPVTALLDRILGHAGASTTADDYAALGVIGADDAALVHATHLAPLEAWLAAPHRGEGVAAADAPGWCAHGRDHLARMVRAGDATGIHPEFVFVFRSFYNLYRLLASLDAPLVAPRGGP